MAKQTRTIERKKEEVPCWVCNGTGKVEEEILIKRSKMINRFNKDYVLLRIQGSSIVFRWKKNKLDEVIMDLIRLRNK